MDVQTVRTHCALWPYVFVKWWYIRWECSYCDNPDSSRSRLPL